jgi:hypothetical protein
LDKFVRQPSTFPTINTLLGGEARYAEFNLRESPAGANDRNMPIHHDRVLESRINRKPGTIPDDICSITYLTDVTTETPCFCVVPRTQQSRSLEDAKDELGSDYKEVRVLGRAGTACLYDIALFHGRLDGSDPVGLRRRTLHQYFTRGGWLGMRPPSPCLTDWNLIPKRLAMSNDPEEKLFFSHWNTAQCEWAAVDFSFLGRARHPRSQGAHFLGFESKEEKEVFFRKHADAGFSAKL